MSATQKRTANTALTTRNVPRDSVTVVTRICGPARFISFQISSVPIIRPKVHSRMCSKMENHCASSTELPNRFSACGPMNIPAISQPKMAGSFSLEISFPAMTAMTMAASSRSTSRTMPILDIPLCDF